MTDHPSDASNPPEEDLTARARDRYDLPFHRAHDIEVVAATAEHARTRIPYDESLLGNPEARAVHGGVISALADLTGALPLVAARDAYTPTIDLRVDYLTHAGEADLEGEAWVRRHGGSVGVSDVVVRSAGKRCAVAKGVYKVGRD